MVENKTYEGILDRMLRSVPDTIDKREGSVIYDALAPAALELAQFYTELEINNNLSFADTATGEYLTRIARDFGVNRVLATSALRRGEFTNGEGMLIRVPLGSRFSISNINYSVVDELGMGSYALRCEALGTIGNQHFGTLLPITYIENLAKGELKEVLITGQEEESDDDLRKRYYESTNEPTFGGNVADYKKYIRTLQGVGSVKVFPSWNGGGTVKCTITDTNFLVPSETLVKTVKETIDPEDFSGTGIGMAPIGHQVHIAGVVAQEISVETTVILAAGMSLGQVQEAIEDVIQSYFSEIRKDWENQKQLVVRISQLDAKVLSVSGVEDITETKLNGVASNILLEEEEIPIFKEVILNG